MDPPALLRGRGGGGGGGGGLRAASSLAEPGIVADSFYEWSSESAQEPKRERAGAKGGQRRWERGVRERACSLKSADNAATQAVTFTA